MLDPFILKLFMDDPFPALQDVAQISAGVIVHNNTEQLSRLNIRVPMNNSRPSFTETFIQNYSDQEYEKKFCMTRSTMEKLKEYLTIKLDETNINVENMQIPLDKKLHILIWILRTEDSYRECANLFNIHKSSVSNIFHEMCEILTKFQHDFIKWPNFEEQDVIKEEIQQKYSYPNCVGLIGACHIPIVGHKNTHSIVLQGVCDHNLIFRNICLGMAGGAADIFTESPLRDQLNDLIQGDNHLLGDLSYSLKSRLMIPFRNKNTLTNIQDNYNKIHRETWSIIKKAFQSLKTKFKRLKLLELNNMKDASTVISAACVLYNFIVLNQLDNKKSDEFVPNDNSLQFGRLTATEKRYLICSVLSQ